jgi:NADPH:quinone reductase-like Zn-dependent oxidoreductase
MRALYAAQLGGEHPLDNIEIGERPKPEPKAGEVRVRMRAATLNHHDLFTLRGVVGYPITLPRILGCDGYGVVDAYGPDGPPGAPALGTEVILYPLRFCGRCAGCTGGDPMTCRSFTLLSDADLEGSFAEYVVLPAQHVVPKPASLSGAAAAALGVTFLTAYRMLFTKAALRPGDSVLVQGAAGGLSSAAIQLAAAAGLIVYVSATSQDRLELARTLGAKDGVLAGRDAAKAIVALNGGEGVDAVIESVGEATFGTSLRAVRIGGTIVVSGATTGANPPANLSRIFWHQLRILGSTMGSLPELRSLIRFVERAKIKPLIDQAYPMEEGKAAFERLERNQQRGKLVIEIARE